jgi:hypothetical protein
LRGADQQHGLEPWGLAGQTAIERAIDKRPQRTEPAQRRTEQFSDERAITLRERIESRMGLRSLELLVERAVNERLLEGQLDECNLTLKDLEIIKRSYIRQLQGVYHPRIEYPRLDELEPAPAHVAEPS